MDVIAGVPFHSGPQFNNKQFSWPPNDRLPNLNKIPEWRKKQKNGHLIDNLAIRIQLGFLLSYFYI